MKTLVTGSTGFLGSSVLRELINDGREVKALIREGTTKKNIEGLDVEIAYGDLRDIESIRSALNGCDILYHVAAYYSLWDRDKQLSHEINVKGTRNILRAAKEKGLNKVVYTSTVGCIGLNEDTTPATENTFFNTNTLSNDYKKSKYQAEQVALEFARGGLPVVIVNPSTPIGPRDIKPTPTGKIILDFLTREMPAYLDTGLNLIDVKDCARGHILAELKGIPGERYILGNQNMTLHEILITLEKITGLKAPRIKMPFWVALSAGWACEMVADHLTGKPPAIPLAGVKMAKHFMYFDSSKAVKKLGLAQNPVENALRQSVDWFKDNNYLTTR
ncbi:MAG TPA: NAD-dependent epimerase/dehydratase family protein [Nitrospinaceae bacterium]|nr:NAD-dependent epimerase/dehydratase family protein [Nitrospinaceae bacterium]